MSIFAKSILVISLLAPCVASALCLPWFTHMNQVQEHVSLFDIVVVGEITGETIPSPEYLKTLRPNWVAHTYVMTVSKSYKGLKFSQYKDFIFNVPSMSNAVDQLTMHQRYLVFLRNSGGFVDAGVCGKIKESQALQAIQFLDNLPQDQ